MSRCLSAQRICLAEMSRTYQQLVLGRVVSPSSCRLSAGGSSRSRSRRCSSSRWCPPRIRGRNTSSRSSSRCRVISCISIGTSSLSNTTGTCNRNCNHTRVGGWVSGWLASQGNTSCHARTVRYTYIVCHLARIISVHQFNVHSVVGSEICGCTSTVYCWYSRVSRSRNRIRYPYSCCSSLLVYLNLVQLLLLPLFWHPFASPHICFFSGLIASSGQRNIKFRSYYPECYSMS